MRQRVQYDDVTIFHPFVGKDVVLSWTKNMGLAYSIDELKNAFDEVDIEHITTACAAFEVPDIELQGILGENNDFIVYSVIFAGKILAVHQAQAVVTYLKLTMAPFRLKNIYFDYIDAVDGEI